MTYATGAITANATPSTALIAQIETTLSAHAAWQFVEEFIAGTMTYRVWRNLGTANGFGQDWYLIMHRLSSGTGNVFFAAAEQYSTTTHAHTHPCPAEPQNISSTNGPIPDADFAYPGGPYPLTGTVGYLGGTDKLFTVQMGTSTTAFDYYYTVTNTGLMIATKVVAVITAGAVGLFDSLLTGGTPDPFPLMIVNIPQSQSSTVSAGAFSRMPRQQLSLPHQFSMQDHATSQASWWNVSVSVTVVGGAAAVSSDRYQQNRPVACRVLLSPRQGLIQPADVGFARGLMKDMIMLNVTGVVVGDTVTIGADTYVYMGVRWHWMNASAA